MNKLNVITAIAVLGLAGCASMDARDEDHRSVVLSEVPAAVIAAANVAVEGIVLTDVEMKEEDGHLVYELEGEANGKEYEISVSADGNVLEVEDEEDDD